MKITFGHVAVIVISSSCASGASRNQLPEPRPFLQWLTTAPWTVQRFVDGVPVGPPSHPQARLERRADTLLVRGPVPRRGLWPPTATVAGAAQVLDLTLWWRLSEEGSYIDIRSRKNSDWEVALAPVTPGAWRVRVTQRDSSGTVLNTWVVDTTLNR